ncbi:MAG: hypothetical protein AAGA96_11540 [Verrucomicrobiota bacterium]
MRTTLTLDDDVADYLKEQCRLLGKPFKQVVNDVMRRGMSPKKNDEGRQKFEITPNKSRFAPGVDPLKLNELNDELEADGYTSKISK